VVGTV